MSALMTSYEEEYEEHNSAIQRDIHTLRGTLESAGSGDRASLLKSLHSTIAKMKEVCTNIEYEANDLTPEKRVEAKQKVADYKRSVFNFEKDVARLKTEVAKKEREELLASANGDGAPAAGGGAASDVERARQQMANNTNKMRKGNETLQAAEQLVNESDRLADDTIGELGKQREKIQAIHRTTQEADEEVNQSRRVLTRMQQVMIQNKAILIVIIIVLLLMIFLVGYMKYSGTGEHKGTAGSTGTTPPSSGDIPTLPPVPPDCEDCLPEASLDHSGDLSDAV